MYNISECNIVVILFQKNGTRPAAYLEEKAVEKFRKGYFRLEQTRKTKNQTKWLKTCLKILFFLVMPEIFFEQRKFL